MSGLCNTIDIYKKSNIYVAKSNRLIIFKEAKLKFCLILEKLDRELYSERKSG